MPFTTHIVKNLSSRPEAREEGQGRQGRQGGQGRQMTIVQTRFIASLTNDQSVLNATKI
ncbi:hypothetical protein [Calothrix parietina]|uniref:Uncharacterized protein n=1 Tax=Calothrix anomala FACHB-343 TaxID=2692894 RepID=A0ABR8AS72_9CYAN|nr:hypothetical protein [Calothrix anomala FACHB-343]